MKIGICDDDPKTREQLNNLCHNLGYIDTYQFDSGEELLSSDICPSLTLVFLDIFYHKKVLNNTMNKLIVLPIIFLWLNCYNFFLTYHTYIL